MKITGQLLKKIESQAVSNRKIFKDFFSKLNRIKPGDLDRKILFYHRQVFAEIDCLECANCCKTISPILFESDISRLARSLKMKVSEFKDRYTRIDEDNDYVFKEIPCPFLMAGNKCMVYDDRPKACREYPHTDRKRFYQILAISEKNRAVCPAVYEITDRLKKSYEGKN